MDIRLTRPITHDGKQIESLALDLDALTGADIEFCAREATAANAGPIAVLILDLTFHLQVAARASKIPADVLRTMSASDYLGMTTQVQGFLAGSG